MSYSSLSFYSTTSKWSTVEVDIGQSSETLIIEIELPEGSGEIKDIKFHNCITNANGTVMSHLDEWSM